MDISFLQTLARHSFIADLSTPKARRPSRDGYSVAEGTEAERHTTHVVSSLGQFPNKDE